MDDMIMDNTGRVDSTIIYSDGRTEPEEAAVLKEHELTVIVNERPVMRLVCTKDHLKELVTGRLFTEGIIDKAEEISSMYFYRYGKEVSVFLSHDIQWDEMIREDKSCCTGNLVFYGIKKRRKPERLKPIEWKPEWIFAMAKHFREGAVLHDMTQGTHSCILFSDGKIIFECEDIGRHNAVDKAVGHALAEDVPLSGCILYTSGRVPVDMTEKVIAAGIPVLVTKSVPTAEACVLARDHALTIISRAHPDSIQIIR